MNDSQDRCADPRILPGVRVLAFDRRLYVDDETTPLSVTMKPATVVCRYGKQTVFDATTLTYPDVVDVVFDHRAVEVSRAHFTAMVKILD